MSRVTFFAARRGSIACIVVGASSALLHGCAGEGTPRDAPARTADAQTSVDFREVRSPGPTREVPAISPVSSVLTVRVDGVESTDAPIFVAVFDEAGWLGATPIASGESPASAPSTIVTIEGLAPGRYGVSLFQDETGDGALDRGRFSIPAEPFGFSNGARISFGPPAFAAAAFEYEGGLQEITIPLQPALVPRAD